MYLGVAPDGTEAAVKVLHVDWDNRGELRRKLNQELLSAQKIAQWVTADILRFELAGDTPYIASEYIKGPTLAEAVAERGPLRGSALHQVAIQTMTALEAIHKARVIHCDFKPGNIILGQGGTRVIDFGIARTLDSTHHIDGRVEGSYPFMAPEQIVGAPLTAAVDLFAWGATMVYAATGRYAFPGHHQGAVVHRILNQEPMLHDLGGPLAGLIRDCLQKEPGRRPTAAQAHRRLLDPREPESRIASPPATVFAVGTAFAVGPAAARPAPGSWRLSGSAGVTATAPTRVERLNHAHHPSHPTNAHQGKWMMAAATAVAAAVFSAMAWAGHNSSDKAGDAGAQQQSTELSTPRDPSRVLAHYVSDWSDEKCTVAAPTRDSQVARRKCLVEESGVRSDLYCVQYERSTVMRATRRPGLPGSGVPPENVEFRSTWSRDDDGRNGAFIAYRFVADDHKEKAALWWEDSTDPVACMIHGPKGTRGALLRAFFDHRFRIRGPLPFPS